ncbi:hypothetical protein GQ602_006895 [Ophiocordyceps camponoti-floridani]|uniref:Uncharacterized protein n=1 Tax=Ophiocordyceps camponoti-floridani TaxID=2030778 RepID=A0A8H4VBC4_9HYPO|nr:hypothetical protein GQ602_006895 [Ophiocordyceps camponoti-floridani]
MLLSPPVILLLTVVFALGRASAVETRTQPPPAYLPVVTPAPDQEAILASQGYRQETFYACRTVGGSQHCGWHVPIVRASATAQGFGLRGVVALVVGFVAGFVLNV